MAIVICNEWRSNGNQLLINQEQESKTTAEMARAAGVSPSTISDAKSIIRAGKADEVLKNGKSIASVARPKEPKPAPLPEPTHEDGDSYDEAEQDIIKNNEELEKGNNSLRALNDSLSASDSGKYYQNLCDKVRKILGVEKYSEIVSALEARLKP